MSRLSVGAQLTLNVKSDWPMTATLGQDGTATVTLPLHDPALLNRPSRLHVVYFRDFVPSGMTPEQAVLTPLHGVVDVPAQPATNDTVFAVPVPGLTPGSYQALLIGEYSS